ncbi:MAG: PDZ domain-containing protein [Nanoarchaeota archaeon]
MKIKLTWRIWLWIIVFLLSLLAIFYNPDYSFQKGVLVTEVTQNSSAFEQGVRIGQIVTAIDGKQISNVEDFLRIIQEKFTSNETIKTTITAKNSEYITYSKNIDLIVSDIPKTNLKLGLDLSGGARALVQAKDHKLTSSEINDLVNVVSNRLNVYGLSDMVVRPVSDLAGNNFMLIEIAGTTPNNLENLVSQQGKFEAKIGNETVFIGGEQDITSVSRSGQDAGIYSCNDISEGSACEFRFVVYLSQASAERHARITNQLEINSTSQGNYLSKKLDLYLDDNLVDSLLISENLKGSVTTQIQISGSGTGATKSDAYDSAQNEMKNLQTVLITGSLPFKLEVVKMDTISPTLGENFSKYILYAGLIALLLVAGVVFIRYRSKSAIAPLIICTSEIIITLGIAAVIKWDLDLASIAGILAAIGTGVDDQIVILDEAKHKGEVLSIKQRIKRAFEIVIGAFLASAVSLLPLLGAGAGLLRGFVITTLIGITVGVFITRRAFADIVKLIEKDNAS